MMLVILQFFLPITDFSLISNTSVCLEQAHWINTSGEVETQVHEIHRQAYWLKEEHFLTYLILTGLGHGVSWLRSAPQTISVVLL